MDFDYIYEKFQSKKIIFMLPLIFIIHSSEFLKAL